MSSLSFSIYKRVDVVVVGSSTAAVAAALNVQKSGRSAMIVSDLSYFGSDLAGRLNLWPAERFNEDPLLQKIFAGTPSGAALPAGIKHSLEAELIEAKIPFLYMSRPVALLKDGSGNLGGVVLSARTSLFAIACGSVIDATDHGIVARLAGIRTSLRVEAAAPVSWNILAKKAPEAWPGQVELIHAPVALTTTADSGEWATYRLSLDRNHSALGSDVRQWEQGMRALLVDDNVGVIADLLNLSPLEQLEGRSQLVHQLSELCASDYQPLPNVWLMNELLPVAAKEWNALQSSPEGLTFAREMGARAAAQIPTPEKELFLWSAGEARKGIQFAAPFLRELIGAVSADVWAASSLGSYDVVVVGGGTGGAPAGIAAARGGARTLVLETQHGLGGVGTIGLITSYYHGNRVGFTSELNAEVNRHDSLSRSKESKRWSPEIKSAVYYRMLRDAGGVAWNGSHAFGVQKEGTAITGLLVSTPFGNGFIDTRCVIDGTGSADVAAAAGAPCRVVGPWHVGIQGAGLSPRFSPEIRHQNSDYTFIDDADPVGVTSAYVLARAKYASSFDVSTLVNTRERRQIDGEIELSPLDMLAGRNFPDTISIASSNFDTHGFTVHPVFVVSPPDHKPLYVNVPFRCLVPKGCDGVLVLGLGMSAHRDAIPVIRMQADVQNQGYAAGLAAAMAVREKQAVRNIDIRKLQEELVKVGILPPEILSSATPELESIDEIIGGDLKAPKTASILMANPKASSERLRRVLQDDPNLSRRQDAALILGLMGDREAAAVLNEMVASTAWDKGWNYRGMGQFGPCMSPLDSVVIALGKAGHPMAIETIAKKILELSETSEFSHCRAVSIAAAMLPHPTIAAAFVEVLNKPEMQGHDWSSVEAMLPSANDDLIDTLPRNRSLREIYLARGLYFAGDVDGLGQRILERYAADLRGPFARHAQAILAAADQDGLRAVLS